MKGISECFRQENIIYYNGMTSPAVGDLEVTASVVAACDGERVYGTVMSIWSERGDCLKCELRALLVPQKRRFNLMERAKACGVSEPLEFLQSDIVYEIDCRDIIGRLNVMHAPIYIEGNEEMWQWLRADYGMHDQFEDLPWNSCQVVGFYQYARVKDKLCEAVPGDFLEDFSSFDTIQGTPPEAHHFVSYIIDSLGISASQMRANYEAARKTTSSQRLIHKFAKLPAVTRDKITLVSDLIGKFYEDNAWGFYDKFRQLQRV